MFKLIILFYLVTNYLFHHNYNIEQVELSVLLTVDYTKLITQIVYTHAVEQIINNEFLINCVYICILFVLFFLIFFLQTLQHCESTKIK